MPLCHFLSEMLLDANPSFPTTEIVIVTDNARPCISTRPSVHTTESQECITPKRGRGDRWKLMVRHQSDSCLVVPKRAGDAPTKSQEYMVRQQSDSCLVVPKRACDSPPPAVSKENLYDLCSSAPPSLASSSSRPQRTRHLATLPRFSVASKRNQQIQERRLHLHLVPQLNSIPAPLRSKGGALEECIRIIDESTDVDRAGVSSDTALTIPERRGSPHGNLKTPCTLPDDILTRAGNMVSPK
jgi:hypothetical protein